MEQVGYYNGTLGKLEEIQCPILDRAVYFGDGCYDATYVQNGVIFALEDHFDRFYNSCRLLRIPFQYSREELKEILYKLVEVFDGNDGKGILYWQTSRGTALRNHIFPDDAVVKNIATYLAQLDELMLWDNTPATDRRDLDLDSLEDGRGKIILDGCGENLGIGSALNKAVAYARANGFTHLLTLDQDSCFGGRNFESYLRAIRSYGENKAAIFSTNYFIKSQQTTMYPPTDSVDEVYSAMTSGSIYPVGLFDTLGDFMESLFVWGVDCEFCWRAKRKDIPVLCFKNILLTHDLGYQKKKRRLLGKEVFPNEYGPARSYYNVRNGILLHRLYPEALNLKSHLRYHFYKRVVFIILYERQKFSKLWALLCGYRDGLRGKSGKWK